MATVYAITDDGDRFVMFQTSREKFAHENAQSTASSYVQNVVAYEWGSQRYAIRNVEFSDDQIKRLLSHVSISVRSAADWLGLYRRQLKLNKTTDFEVMKRNQRLIAELDRFEETN